jgi:type 1 fimbria pilin
MRTMRNMRFSEVQPSQQMISIDPLSNTETGKMIAIGDVNAQIRVSYIKQRTLTHPDGSTLTFTYTVAGNDEDDQSSAEILQSDNRDLTLNAEGKYFFWIGGQVNVENAKPGGYNGNFTIEVEYI